MGVSQVRGTFLMGPYNKDYNILYWGLHWGPLILVGNYHIEGIGDHGGPIN